MNFDFYNQRVIMVVTLKQFVLIVLFKCFLD